MRRCWNRPSSRDEYQAGGGESRSVLWLTAAPQANTGALFYTVIKSGLVWSRSLFVRFLVRFIYVSDFQRFVSRLHPGSGVWQSYQWNRISVVLCFLLPPTVCSFGLSHIQTSHGMRQFVMAAVQRRCCSCVQAVTHPGWDEVGCGTFVSASLWTDSFYYQETCFEVQKSVSLSSAGPSVSGFLLMLLPPFLLGLLACRVLKMRYERRGGGQHEMFFSLLRDWGCFSPPMFWLLYISPSILSHRTTHHPFTPPHPSTPPAHIVSFNAFVFTEP